MSKLDELLKDQQFRNDWTNITRKFHEHGINELVLEKINEAVDHLAANNPTELNSVAAIHTWQVRGALHVWDFLQNLLYDNKQEESIDNEDYTGEI